MIIIHKQMISLRISYFLVLHKMIHPVLHVVHLYVVPFFIMYVKEGPWKLFGSISISEIRSLHYANLLWIHKAPLKSMQIYSRVFLQVSKNVFKSWSIFWEIANVTYLVWKNWIEKWKKDYSIEFYGLQDFFLQKIST